MNKQGKITPNGVLLEKHEYDTILIFTKLGYDIELIPKSYRIGVHSADIKMAGLEWEIKSPKGSSKWLIQNTIAHATRQSSNIILDLRRIQRGHEQCIREAKREFIHNKKVKRLKIITKTGKIIDFYDKV